MTTPRIAVIIGTTRPTRFGEKPAEWIKDKIAADGRMSVDVLDLAEYDLPFFDEMFMGRRPVAETLAAAQQAANTAAQR